MSSFQQRLEQTAAFFFWPLAFMAALLAVIGVLLLAKWIVRGIQGAGEEWHLRRLAAGKVQPKSPRVGRRPSA